LSGAFGLSQLRGTLSLRKCKGMASLMTSTRWSGTTTLASAGTSVFPVSWGSERKFTESAGTSRWSRWWSSDICHPRHSRLVTSVRRWLGWSTSRCVLLGELLEGCLLLWSHLELGQWELLLALKDTHVHELLLSIQHLLLLRLQHLNLLLKSKLFH
jgi:hypothetical protein